MIPPRFTCNPEVKRGKSVPELIRYADEQESASAVASALLGVIDSCNWGAYHQETSYFATTAAEELTWMSVAYQFVDIADMFALDSTNTPEKLPCR